MKIAPAAPTIVAAEDVLPGHPDRLCDAVAETSSRLHVAMTLRRSSASKSPCTATSWW